MRARTFRRLKYLQYGLVTVGILCLGTGAATNLGTHLYQRDRLRLLQNAGGATPVADMALSRKLIVVPKGAGLVGQLKIPRLGISAAVTEGVDRLSLLRAIGHLPGTPVPGQQGNIVLAGHRDTFFRKLRNVQRGDSINIVTTYGDYLYVVDSTRIVSPRRTDLLTDDDAPSLTLVTCYPFHYVGRAPKRFLVTARQTDPPPDPTLDTAMRLEVARGPEMLNMSSTISAEAMDGHGHRRPIEQQRP